MFTRVFTIPWFLRKKKIVIHYTEGTIKDYIFFRELSEKEHWAKKWFYEFLIQVRPKTTFEEFLKLSEIQNFNNILDDIISTRFEGIFRKVDENADEKTEKNQEVKVYDLPGLFLKFKSSVAWFAKENHISYKHCIETHTLSELFDFWEAYIYNENEKTEKGSEANVKKLKLLKIAEMERLNIL